MQGPIEKTSEETSTEHLLSKGFEKLTIEEIWQLEKALKINFDRRIANALIEHKGARKKVAEIVGISERTLYRKIKELSEPIRQQLEAVDVL